jgi:nitronate monooxygenase
MAKPVLRTKLCDALGIEYPIVLAGMGDPFQDSAISTGKLAGAVSNAGGLGMIGGGWLSTQQLRKEIADARSVTTKPFGVDLIFPATAGFKPGTMAEVKAQLPKEQVDFVEGLWNRFGVKRVKAPEIKMFDEENARNQWKVVLDSNLPCIALGLGTPDWLVREAHDHGMKVISLIGNVKQARRIAEMGVDFIVAQGTEAGGHTGRIGLLTLLPQVVEAISPIPVLAAGGITVGSQLAAVLTLGAVGVWAGTAFQATLEGSHSESIREYFINATDDSTVVTKTLTGKTARTIRSAFTEIWEKEGPPALPMPYQAYLMRDFLYAVIQQGKGDIIKVVAGQGVGLIKEIRSVHQVVDELVQGAIEALKKRLPHDVTM